MLQKRYRLCQKLQLEEKVKMRNIPTLAIAAILALTILLVAACAPKTAEQPPAAPSTQAAAEVPEIAQAEQTVQEIGTSDLDEIDGGLDALTLP